MSVLQMFVQLAFGFKHSISALVTTSTMHQVNVVFQDINRGKAWFAVTIVTPILGSFMHAFHMLKKFHLEDKG